MGEGGAGRGAPRQYIAIDLKSFYASVECQERGLNPLTTNLLVADESRTSKTIVLAVSPSLKAYGIPGRPRLFEAEQRVEEVNRARAAALRGKPFSGSSWDAEALRSDPTLAVDYIVAPPRMAYYMEYSARVYEVYLKYIAPEDIHVYSIDEVFMDVTDYLATYKQTAHELAVTILRDVLETTGMTATVGIGTNLYLAKIAMDIVAKKMPADKDGVRIAELDEASFRRQLWTHVPLTDFWRIGKGITRRLKSIGLETMGDIARCSLGKPGDYYNEDLLYKVFGVQAELLIDHAWGIEPCRISDIKNYVPENMSLTQGQVLPKPYTAEAGRLIIREMTDLLSMDLVSKQVETDQLVLSVGYDIENLTKEEIRNNYDGPVEPDWYGRPVPKPAHGSINLEGFTSSSGVMMDAIGDLYDRIVHPALLVRRMTVAANHIRPLSARKEEEQYRQLDIFQFMEETDETADREKKQEARAKEEKIQQAILEIRNRYGKNALLRGMNLQEEATTRKRNREVGGHKA